MDCSDRGRKTLLQNQALFGRRKKVLCTDPNIVNLPVNTSPAHADLHMDRSDRGRKTYKVIARMSKAWGNNAKNAANTSRLHLRCPRRPMRLISI